MARVPMVTRTMTTTHATVMCVNVETAEVENRTYDIPREPKDEETILLTCRKVEADPKIRLVSVVRTVVDTALYRMSEEAFMAAAERCEQAEADADSKANESEVNG